MSAPPTWLPGFSLRDPHAGPPQPPKSPNSGNKSTERAESGGDQGRTCRATEQIHFKRHEAKKRKKCIPSAPVSSRAPNKSVQGQCPSDCETNLPLQKHTWACPAHIVPDNCYSPTHVVVYTNSCQVAIHSSTQMNNLQKVTLEVVTRPAPNWELHTGHGGREGDHGPLTAQLALSAPANTSCPSGLPACVCEFGATVATVPLRPSPVAKPTGACWETACRQLLERYGRTA